jgi:hypothetical protein
MLTTPASKAAVARIEALCPAASCSDKILITRTLALWDDEEIDLEIVADLIENVVGGGAARATYEDYGSETKAATREAQEIVDGVGPRVEPGGGVVSAGGAPAVRRRVHVGAAGREGRVHRQPGARVTVRIGDGDPHAHRRPPIACIRRPELNDRLIEGLAGTRDSHLRTEYPVVGDSEVGERAGDLQGMAATGVGNRVESGGMVTSARE